jgi:hypothetical protein
MNYRAEAARGTPSLATASWAVAARPDIGDLG